MTTADVLTGVRVHTWADGYGTWHARVTMPHNADSFADAAVMREAARAAILAEITERAPRGFGDYRPALRHEDGGIGDGVGWVQYVEDEPHGVPASHPVRVLDVDEPAGERVTCGACGRSWDDAVSTSWTPTHGPRCAFEPWCHDEDDDAEPWCECGAVREEDGTWCCDGSDHRDER